VRLTILSRASDLARLQALLVGRALTRRWPDLDLVYLTRTSSGDRDNVTPLAALPEKGAFTADLTEALASGAADCVVHSWKDLPLEGRPDTVIAATLERADTRDVLLVRRDAITERPRELHVLSSSPRRVWLLERALPELLPWPIERVTFAPVRGNIQTRLKRLIEGRGHALVVAKAALDRLLGFGEPFDAVAAEVRAALEECRFMVLPLRDVPGAPAQGAVAIEVAISNQAARDRIEAICHKPTWDAVQAERRVLAAHGGGCHEAVGATVLPREYGRIVSVKAKTSVGGSQDSWSLEIDEAAVMRASAENVYPRPDERQGASRRALDVQPPADADGFWVARAEALPASWTVSADRFVWAAGGRTWRKLAARGVWVNGCADGLGEVEPAAIDVLAGRAVTWLRLTHAAAAEAGALATYEVDETLPDDLPSRTHFFWTSGHLFKRALARWPELAARSHASGPGRTWHTLRAQLPAGSHLRVWLDYDHWLKEMIG
jgi:hydroxymethylbilane synthase